MKKAYFGLFILLLPILVSCNKQKNFLALGNFNDEAISNLKTLLKMDGNNYFVSENMQSGRSTEELLWHGSKDNAAMG